MLKVPIEEPVPNRALRQRTRATWLVRLVIAGALCSIALPLAYKAVEAPVTGAFHALGSTSDICPQEPEYDLEAALGGLKLKKPSVKTTVERLSRAVQIDTTVGDSIAPPEELPEYWDRIFSPFRKFLEHEFPLVHDKLTREIVHEHGLLFTWKGSDPALKPLVLMAHQDVVPVAPDSRSDWKEPPFAGTIDLEHQTVWGRGSFDCKSVLVSTMVAVENLIASGFRPNRTVILSFGYDEESNGVQGAKALGELLYERLGPDSVAMIIDEGFNNVPTDGLGSVGMPVATPCVQEKGATNINMVIKAPGGHSSVAPPHTAIGIMSEMLVALEANPFVPLITSDDPSIKRLQCTRDAPKLNPALRDALYELEWAEKSASGAFDEAIRAALPMWMRFIDQLIFAPPLRAARLERARARVLSLLSPLDRTFFQTTQAIDLINGGVKINALPETVVAGINHRIVPYATAQVIRDHYRKVVLPIAQKYGLAVDFFGERTGGGAAHATLEIYHVGTVLEQLPRTPISGPEAAQWRLLSSVIRRTFHTDEPRIVLPEEPRDDAKYHSPITVAPGTMIANTDTHWYKRLSRHIFRYGTGSVHTDLTGLGPMTGIHTVNEHFSIDAIAKAVEFYTNIIVAMDHEHVN
ncbi:Gly-Xaa carboxypeptidase [Malassezia cuniculi]|uniref:Gly-Xaa carboxypeptidase n=1 Tax=Malassezia cuniculi TaxID=948313 RepID=A0AAF0EVG2_9BASI|nr:Gly-Xaa carboxypeptidase [Malassezia cuniculi]